MVRHMAREGMLDRFTFVAKSRNLADNYSIWNSKGKKSKRAKKEKRKGAGDKVSTPQKQPKGPTPKQLRKSKEKLQALKKFFPDVKVDSWEDFQKKMAGKLTTNLGPDNLHHDGKVDKDALKAYMSEQGMTESEQKLSRAFYPRLQAVPIHRTRSKTPPKERELTPEKDQESEPSGSHVDRQMISSWQPEDDQKSTSSRGSRASSTSRRARRARRGGRGKFPDLGYSEVI